MEALLGLWYLCAPDVVQLAHGGELPSAGTSWGLGSTKLDWEEQLANLEKALGTPSSRSTSVSHVDICVLLVAVQVWCWPAMLVSI